MYTCMAKFDYKIIFIKEMHNIVVKFIFIGLSDSGLRKNKCFEDN